MIPQLGFGTWRLSGRACEEGVADALAAGYRHIDTAAMYDNEEDVGRGLRAAGVDRSDVWVTTKVWTDALEPERLRASLERSLRRLELEHVDLLLDPLAQSRRAPGTHAGRDERAARGGPDS